MKTKSIHQNRFVIWRAPRQDEVNMFDNVDALSKLRQTHTHTRRLMLHSNMNMHIEMCSNRVDKMRAVN